MKFKIALVQFNYTFWNPKKNIERMEEFVEQAKKNQANVVLFPEDCVTGPMLKNQEMLDRTNHFKDTFSNLAHKYQIDLVPGSWMEEDADQKGWYNTTYYFDAHGKVLNRYRKVNLWISERSYLTPGNSIQVFNTKYGKAGLIICWDLMSPEIFRQLLSQGVQIVYCPSDWSMGLVENSYNKNAEIDHVNALCTARAVENNIILAYCNLAGEHSYEGKTDHLIGQTQITMPFYGKLAHLQNNQENLLIQEVDLDLLPVAEKVYQTRGDYLKNIS